MSCTHLSKGGEVYSLSVVFGVEPKTFHWLHQALDQAYVAMRSTAIGRLPIKHLWVCLEFHWMWQTLSAIFKTETHNCRERSQSSSTCQVTCFPGLKYEKTSILLFPEANPKQFDYSWSVTSARHTEQQWWVTSGPPASRGRTSVKQSLGGRARG